MMLMSTYGSLEIKEGQRDSHRDWFLADGESCKTTFKYTETFGNHFEYHDAVDAHNSKRHEGGTHQGISLETTWVTCRWENRVFCFIITVAEVNAYLACRYFFNKEEEFMDFQKMLAKELLYNTLDDDVTAASSGPSTRGRAQSPVHKLVKAPKNSKFEDGEWCACYKRMSINSCLQHRWM